MKITIPETKCFSCKNGWSGPGTIKASVPEFQQYGIHPCPYCKGKGVFPAYTVEFPDNFGKDIKKPAQPLYERAGGLISLK